MFFYRAVLGMAALTLLSAGTTGEIRASVGVRRDSTRPVRVPVPRPRVDSIRCPLLFIENRGQVDARVAYYAPGKGLSVYFTSEGLTWALTDGKRRWAVKQDFVGARKDARPVARDRRETVFSWFKGPKSQWKTGVPSFGTLEYADLWPGIDMVCTAGADRMKTLFVVKPGADPGRIRFAWRGAASVGLTGTGSLRVETPVGGFEDDTPAAWQEVEGARTGVESEFAIQELPQGETHPVWGFRMRTYNHGQPLLLDPVIVVYAGYLGGASDDDPVGISVDTSGSAYVVGYTQSPESSFPVVAGPDLSYNGGTYDAFVTKVRADGTGLVYCSYIGGAGSDYAYGIAVDASGSAFVTGGTSSSESSFPVTNGPHVTYRGGSDAFVAKVLADGEGLAYCGYIGGVEYEFGYGIAFDSSGSAYVAGETWSSQASLPVTAGPDLTYAGNIDGFIAKVRADGTGLVYCGYIGGSGEDIARGIAVDISGNAYVVGSASSSEASFPVSAGPDLTYNGGDDAFVAKVRADGAGLAYCGYIGGSGDEGQRGVAVDASGNAYVAGFTNSSEASFPVTAGPDLTFNGNTDAFVAKVRADGTGLIYCGYIGGTGSDGARGIAADALGNAYVGGVAGSSEASFPVIVGPDLTLSGGDDAFVAKVRADGTSLVYCGYIGGVGDDDARGIAVDASGSAYVTGGISSFAFTFPVTAGPDLASNGGDEAFVAKVSPGIPTAPSALAAAAITPSRIDLSWADNSADESGQEVQRSVEGGAFAPIAALATDNVSYSDTLCVPLTAYSYQVRATNEAGATEFSASASATTPGTLALAGVKGTLKESAKAAGDSFEAKGAIAFNSLAVDAAFDPAADGLSLSFGEPGNRFAIVLPIGSEGWKSRKDKFTWKSARGETPKAKITLNLGKGSFAVSVKSFDFPAAPTGPVAIFIRTGNDAGAVEDAWTPVPKKAGVLRKR